MNNNNLDVKKISGFSVDNEGFQVFKDGWKFISETGGEANLSVNVEGKNIFLLYKAVKVDDKEEIIIDTFFKDGWGDYSATEVLVEDLLNGSHKIEIKVLDDNKSIEAYIMGFLVS